MKIDGGCHCGAITYEAEVRPELVTVCHCTDCQTMSGSAFRTVAPTVKGSFRLLSGTPTAYTKTADSGRTRIQTFCPTCGSPIYSGPAEDAEGRAALRVGTIRQRDQLRPAQQIWCDSAQEWLADIPHLAGKPRQ